MISRGRGSLGYAKKPDIFVLVVFFALSIRSKEGEDTKIWRIEMFDGHFLWTSPKKILQTCSNTIRWQEPFVLSVVIVGDAPPIHHTGDPFTDLSASRKPSIQDVFEALTHVWCLPLYYMLFRSTVHYGMKEKIISVLVRLYHACPGCNAWNHHRQNTPRNINMNHKLCSRCPAL